MTETKALRQAAEGAPQGWLEMAEEADGGELVKTHYPVFLDLAGRRVVVVGGGRVAARKVRGLAEAGARVTVIAPQVAAGLRADQVRRRKYRTGDLKGATLAFAAADDRDVNHAVAMEARRRRVPVNVADSREECTFLVPARVRRGALQIAVSTGGKDPRVAKRIRERLERELRREAGGARAERAGLC